MELQNDPRFFQGNVIDKRLAALKSLTIVSSLMVGTSIGLLFSLKKEWNFEAGGWCIFTGAAQISAFLTEMCVAFMCLVALYTMCQQLYHIYRLMTSGPTGVELAGEYYLDPVVVVWRHTAVKSLLNGLVAFVIGAGAILFIKFVKDGDSLPQCFPSDRKKQSHQTAEIIDALARLQFNLTTAPPNITAEQSEGIVGIKHEFHFAMAVLNLVAFFAFAYMLHHIKRQHHRVFGRVYEKVHLMLPTTRAWSQASWLPTH